jgi:hypothetical protein
VNVLFQLHNGGTDDATDLVVTVSLLLTSANRTGESRVVAGPLTFRSSTALLAGYSANFEIVLRNVSFSDCTCVPAITVAHADDDSQ